MNRIISATGVGIMLVGVLVLGGLLPLSTTGTCVLSVTKPTTLSTVCPSDSTYIDNFLYTSSSSSLTGLWSGSTTGTLGGFLKVYYFLNQGTTLRSYTLSYNACTGTFQNMTGLSAGTDSTGLTWFGATVPSGAFVQGCQTDFRATATDTAGGGGPKDGFFTYDAQAGSFLVTFNTLDGTNAGTTTQLSGVQFIITDSRTGSTVGQAVTVGGSASVSLPNNGDTYHADVSPPATYYPVSGVNISPGNSQFTFILYHGPACTSQSQTNCYPYCALPGMPLSAGQQTCNTYTTTTCNSALSSGVISTVSTSSGVVTVATSCTTLTAQTSFTTCSSTGTAAVSTQSSTLCINPTTITGINTNVTVSNINTSFCYTSVLTTTETVAGHTTSTVGTSCTVFGGGGGGNGLPGVTGGSSPLGLSLIVIGAVLAAYGSISKKESEA